LPTNFIVVNTSAISPPLFRHQFFNLICKNPWVPFTTLGEIFLFKLILSSGKNSHSDVPWEEEQFIIRHSLPAGRRQARYSIFSPGTE
jgi:hypothetical protein